ncbi:MAG: protein kinase [Verrucomicrobiales bacterium]|nr:protein kinase [Verrucomicrobiales bacterium]
MLDAYEFIRLLGRGGMGAVYQARQKSLDRLVAIKILPAQLEAESESGDFHFAERFQREARAMAKLSHPNIVAVYDFGQSRDGQFYFVMEYVEGTDLHALIRGGQMTTAHVAGWMSQICEALQYAHDKGIVHRDIKPANIMITREGQVKVADFGLAKLAGGDMAEQTKLTMTNMAMGTPDYVAPEALEIGVEIDHRADLYALGVMLYEMLTGKVPRGVWKMPSVQVEGLDSRYDALIERAMDADRENRFQKASEISATIYEISTTQPLCTSRPKLAMGSAPGPNAASVGERTRQQSPAPTKGKAPAPPAASKSPVGLIVGLAGGAVALGLTTFLIFKSRDPEPAVAPSPSASQSVGQRIVAPTPTPPPAPVATPDPVPAAPAPKPTTPSPSPVVAAPNTPPAAPIPFDAAGWTDLLATADVARDTVTGKWERTSGGLRPQREGSHVFLEFQPQPSEEYDYLIEFTVSNKVVTDVSVSQVFVASGQPLALMMRGDRCFLGPLLDGMDQNNPDRPADASSPALGIEGGRPVRALLEVRRGGIRVLLDDQEIIQWSGDSSRLKLHSSYRLRDRTRLAIGGQHADVVFHRALVRAAPGAQSASKSGPTPAPTASPTPASPPTPTPMSNPVPAVPPAPTDPVSIRLLELEKAYQAAYATQVAAVHDQAVADLNAKYGAALDRGIATASQAGKLDEALALRDEKTLVQSQGHVPEEDAADLPAAIAALRKTWREAHAPILATRDRNAAPLLATYDRALAAYQDELTRAQNLDGASRVKAVRDRIASGEAPATAAPATKAAAPSAAVGSRPGEIPTAPVAPSLRADQVLPPLPKASAEEIRALCEWALTLDTIRLDLLDSSRPVTVAKGQALPKGAFKLIGFRVDRYPMDDTGLKHFAVLGRAPDLETLEFLSSTGPFPIEALRGATKLKSLTPGATSYDETAFAHLAGLKDLQRLVIMTQVEQFTGLGLGYMPESLQELHLDSPTLTGEGMAYLARFKSLRVLSFDHYNVFSRCNVTDAMLGGLAALRDLEDLNLSGCPVNGTLLAAIPPNSKLKRLNLRATSTFDPAHFVHLAKLGSLENLILPPVEITPGTLALLGKLESLSELIITENRTFSGETFRGVKGFRNLVNIDLELCPITDAGLDAIGEALPGLKRIHLAGRDNAPLPATAAGFAAFVARVSGLESLSLSGPTISNEWTTSIGKLPQMGYLVLTATAIDDDGLRHLQPLPLTYLRLSGSKITDASIPLLKTFAKLNNVVTDGTGITPAGRAELDAFYRTR